MWCGQKVAATNGECTAVDAGRDRGLPGYHIIEGVWKIPRVFWTSAAVHCAKTTTEGQIDTRVLSVLSSPANNHNNAIHTHASANLTKMAETVTWPLPRRAGHVSRKHRRVWRDSAVAGRWRADLGFMVAGVGGWLGWHLHVGNEMALPESYVNRV